LYPLDDRQYVRDRAGGGQEGLAIRQAGRQGNAAARVQFREHVVKQEDRARALAIRDQGVPAEPERQGNAPLLAL
jgi:hypothetical protein